MYKVLIIDDEENVRDAIKILGNWESLGVDEILEAQDGKSGHALLIEKKPDIVLLDMRMPEMNGVEFLQAAEKDYPNAIYIVISGYDDFEFTRQAIKSKVFDYLLKPINRQQINTALENAIESIRKKRERQSEQLDRSIKMNMSLHTLKEKIFMSAIDGSFNNQINATYLKMIGIDGKTQRYGAAILRILNLDEICSLDFGKDFDILYFALLNIIDEICEESFEHFCCKNTHTDREIVIIVIDSENSTRNMEELAAHALKRAIRKLNELLSIKAVGSVGNFNFGAASLAVSYRMANTSINNINLLDLSEPVARGDGKITSSKSNSILSKMTLLKSAMESGNLDYANGILDEYLRRIQQSGYFTLREAARTINEFIFMLNDITLEFDAAGSGVQDIESILRTDGISFDYSSFEGFQKILHDIIAFFCNQIRLNMKTIHKFNAEDIKDYIDKNYFQEIKLSMFTEKYYLSKVYIMKLFKQDYGMSIYEYVQKVRMEKAKELLKDPKINIQNVSQMVGYSNNNYFSKAFKNYYHLSPSSYRLMALDIKK